MPIASFTYRTQDEKFEDAFLETYVLAFLLKQQMEDNHPNTVLCDTADRLRTSAQDAVITLPTRRETFHVDMFLRSGVDIYLDGFKSAIHAGDKFIAYWRDLDPILQAFKEVIARSNTKFYSRLSERTCRIV